MPAPPCLASFALPAVALGAAAAAASLPILIHLLSRQRFQVVEWAAIRFLRAAQKRHRRRVDRWVLLAARVLALLVPLLALCAATPWAESIWQLVRPGADVAVASAPRTHRVLVLDCSLSMTARAGDRTRFEVALEQVEQAIRAAQPGDAFTLITLGHGGAQAVVPGPAADPERVLHELRGVKASHAAADLAGGLALVADTLGRSPRSFPRKQVLLFTDLQRSAWAGLLPKPDGTAPEAWQRVLSRAEFAVVDAAAGGEAENLAVTDLSLADETSLGFLDAPTAVQATVQNFGRTEKKQVRLELSLGRPAGVGDAPVLPLEQRVIESIEPGKSVTVRFVLEGGTRFREPGPHLLQAKLLEGDDLPADDVRSLVVDVREGLNAVVVSGQRGPNLLMTALSPAGPRLASNRARPRLLSLAEFADPIQGDLTAVDCVFLCDVPSLAPAQIARLEAHLKRGGGVVFGLGPNAAANAEFYNRTLYADGGGLFPGRLGAVAESGPDGAGFRLFGSDEAFRLAPLAAFRDDNVRAGLSGVPFAKYLKLDAPVQGRARRILSFAAPPTPGEKPAAVKPPEPTPERADPALVEWPRHRGTVAVYTSSFNRDWTEWPILLTYLPFAHELLHHAAATTNRHTLRVGEPLEEFVPVNQVGLNASVSGPDGVAAEVPVVAGDEVGVVRFADTGLSGVYRVAVAGRQRLFAVNVAESNAAGASESDLKRLDPSELKPLGAIPVVTTPTDVALAQAGAVGDTAAQITLGPRPHGPDLARFFLTVALLLLLGELALAMLLGPARNSGFAPPAAAVSPRRGRRLLGLALAAVPLLLAVALLAVRFHEEATGELLGFLPERTRGQVERLAGVPQAAAGEGTRWRLESVPVYLKNARGDQRLLFALFALAAVAVVTVYRLDRRAAGRTGRVLLPGLLRLAALGLILFIMLPQLRLAFDREGWPDVAVLLDTSASMATADELQDPAVVALARKLDELEGVSAPDRLRLAKAVLTRGDPDLLTRLLADRQVKVHVYSLADQAKLVAELNGPDDLQAGRDAVAALKADGESSRLGDGIQAVLKAFRGGSLNAVIVFTDGVVTGGDDLPRAGREAARAGVPLYLVGVGESREALDFAVSDLKSDDTVLKGDTLVIEARLSARGIDPKQAANLKPVPVILYERQGDQLVERGRDTVTPDAGGKPVAVRLSTTPTQVGEKTFVIEVARQAGETELGNNRLERVVLVTETKKLRVLYLESYPRYEFRFLKSFLERELAEVPGGKSIELNTVLFDASPGYAEQDKSALRALPTRTELFAYDAVILGDVDPASLTGPGGQLFQDLADFVKVRGGGLLVVAGAQSAPAKYFATPLGEVLPVAPADSPALNPADNLTKGYRLKLTPYGVGHPLFRLAADPAENAKVWAELQPLFWAAGNYRAKLGAEVLAVHPGIPADAGTDNHPLVLQQFAGAGRVVFFGFDETWRWRFRQSEERYNQFWVQAIRLLARNRVTRPELRTDKQTAYRRDEPIRLTVRFPDDAPAPAENAPIRVRVDRGPLRKPDGTPGVGSAESQTAQLAKVEGSRATYQTLLTRTPEGEYHFELTDPAPTAPPGATASPNRPRAEARVLPPPGERDRLEMDRGALMQAASASRGKFYTLADAATLVDDLPEGARVPLNQPVPPLPVWNQAALFALLAALVGSEWLLRRRERLL